MLRVHAPLQPGDIVAVNHGAYGRKEGLVVGSHIDYAVSSVPFLHLIPNPYCPCPREPSDGYANPFVLSLCRVAR